MIPEALMHDSRTADAWVPPRLPGPQSRPPGYTFPVLGVEQVGVTRSPAETHALGAALGRRAQVGDFICLRGMMGAGKTAFAQGIAAGLGVTEPVSSPTFTLVQEYEGRLRFWHIDAYRLRDEDEAVDLGLEDMARAGGVVVVEWPERIERLLPADRLEITLAPQEVGSRHVTLRPLGERAAALAAGLTASPEWQPLPPS